MSYPILDDTLQLDTHPEFHNAWVNVKAHYGAVGDGTTDDLAAIGNAITAATATGGTVYFPPGTYIVSGQLDLAEGVSFLGAGADASVIKCKSTSTTRILLIQNEGNLTIQGLTFDLNKAATTNGGVNTEQMAIYMVASNSTGVTGVTIRDCVFRNGHQVGVRGTASSYSFPLSFAVDNCEVTGFAGIGIQATRARTMSVTRCYSHANNVGIDALAGLSDLIAHNRCDANTTEGIVTLIAGSDKSTGARIIGNTCNDNGTDTGGNLGWGIALSTQGQKFTVTGNTCRGNYQGGITADVYVGASVVEDAYGTITGNVCSDTAGTNGSHGISVNYGRGVSVTGNVCDNNDNAGIFINGTNCVIAGNILTNNATYGLRLEGDTTYTPDAGGHVVGLNFAANNTSGAIYENAAQAGTNNYLTYQTGTPRV